MTTITRRRSWLEAFMPGCNSSHVTKVRNYMRDSYGWRVVIDDDSSFIRILETNVGEYDYYEEVHNEELEELWHNHQTVLSHLISTCIRMQHVRDLNEAFGGTHAVIGRYAMMPLPKDIKKESKL